jgi:hypothetical protein
MGITFSDLKFNPPTRAAGWPQANWSPPPNFYVTGITIGVAGTVQIITEAGDNTTIPALCLAVGTQHAMHFSELVYAGTSAADIVIFGHATTPP